MFCSPVRVEGCRPALFWSLARHGARNPGEDDILELGEKLPGIRDQILAAWEGGGGELTKENMAGFMDWTFDLSLEDASLLTR